MWSGFFLMKGSPGLIGGHQVDNAALTLSACEMLIRSGVSLSKENIQAGLILNRWPGRLADIAAVGPRKRGQQNRLPPRPLSRGRRAVTK